MKLKAQNYQYGGWAPSWKENEMEKWSSSNLYFQTLLNTCSFSGIGLLVN